MIAMGNFIHALRVRRHLPSPRRLLQTLKKTALRRRILGWLIGLCGAGWLTLGLLEFERVDLPMDASVREYSRIHLEDVEYGGMRWTLNYLDGGRYLPYPYRSERALPFSGSHDLLAQSMVFMTAVAITGWFILGLVRRIRVRLRARRLARLLKEKQQSVEPPAVNADSIGPAAPL